MLSPDLFQRIKRVRYLLEEFLLEAWADLVGFDRPDRIGHPLRLRVSAVPSQPE